MIQDEPLSTERNCETEQNMIRIANTPKHVRLMSSKFSRILDCWLFQQLEILDRTTVPCSFGCLVD
jgi:hypothetical protein